MIATAIWQLWIVPDRPGLRQLLLVIIAVITPIPVAFAGAQWWLPVLVGSVTLGVGLGLVWLLLCGWPWLRRAPLSSLAVLSLAFGSAINLDLLPRVEVLLRAQAATREADWWWSQTKAGVPLDPPVYDAGDRLLPFTLPATGAVVAYTAEPLRRWSWRGPRNSAYVLLRRDGERKVVKTASDLHTELTR